MQEESDELASDAPFDMEQPTAQAIAASSAAASQDQLVMIDAAGIGLRKEAVDAERGPTKAEDQAESQAWLSKNIVLIRHGRSSWNEFLGAHKIPEWEEEEKARVGLRKAIYNMMSRPADVGGSSESLDPDVTRGGTPNRSRDQYRLYRTETTRSGSATPMRRDRKMRTAASPTFGQEAGHTPSQSSAAQSPWSRKTISEQAVTVNRCWTSTPTHKAQHTSDMGAVCNQQSTDSKKRGFWRAVRGNFRHVGVALAHANNATHVDHSLSAHGFDEARQLRKRVLSLMAESTGSRPAAGCNALIQCRSWFVSPFLRALQTAACALSPLYKLDPSLSMQVTPQANEIASSQMSMDCQGKKGNVGLRVLTRAVAKLMMLYDIQDSDDAARASSPDAIQPPVDAERQAELRDVTSTLFAMDVSEVAQVWWKPQSTPEQEDTRVHQLVARMLRVESPSVGLVAHSILFRRILQLFWPEDEATQARLRAALRNGAPADTPDPYHDKIINCGSLVLTLRYQMSGSSCIAEIVDAEFLFEGCMEGGLSSLGRESYPGAPEESQERRMSPYPSDGDDSEEYQQPVYQDLASFLQDLAPFGESEPGAS